MNRATRFAPWSFTIAAVAILVAGVGFGTLGGPTWQVAIAVAAVAALIISYRVHRMPLLFGIAVALGGVRVMLFDTRQVTNRLQSVELVDGVANIAVGIALTAILAVALRFRRGGLDARDGIDLVTVAIGATLSTWIVVTSRAIYVDDVGVVEAFGATMFIPTAALLFTFILDLLFTGLRSNRTMLLLVFAAAANMVGAATAASGLAGFAGVARETEVALFAAAALLLCGALSHADAPETLSLDRSDEEEAAAYTPLRLALTGGCLIVPGVLVASLAPFGRADVLVRVSLLLALVCAVIIRLFIALRSYHEANEALVGRLHLDDLTKLPTRERFVAEVDDVLEATWRSEFQPTLIQLNLDRFKNINDSLGHYEANEVLVRVAERLSAVAADFGGVVARCGGDDFVIVDATTGSSEEAIARVEAVRAALAEPVRVGDASVFVTAAYGVAVAPRHRTLAAEEFMRRADIATHQAKAGGRNSLAVFDDSMQAHLAHRMDVEHALHGAIGRNEMRLYHQPIVDIRTGKVSGFESLIRWLRDGTIVPPGDFIEIAEETGIICELGAWALGEALSELRGWIDDGVVDPTTTISVNVSPRQVADPDFAGVVESALEQSGLPAELLWLEMTESMMLDEPELAEATLRDIRGLGVSLALDDFGTGYSSLSLLQQFPIQRIKIDRAFVNGIAEQGNDRSLVRTIIAMAQSMGLDLVAEGVETIHQLEALSELGCDRAQGFLISRPVPADAMRSTMVALQELASLSMFDSGDDLDGVVTPIARVERSPGRAGPKGPRSAPLTLGSSAGRPLGLPAF